MDINYSNPWQGLEHSKPERTKRKRGGETAPFLYHSLPLELALRTVLRRNRSADGPLQVTALIGR